MELKNVKRYFPEEPEFGADVMYYIDENGLDFYESVNKFTKKYKCCVEPDSGIVRSVAEDAAHLYPVGFNIVETDKLPEGFDICGGWVFSDKKIVKRKETTEELVSQASAEKSRLLAEATAAIAPLNDALEEDMATDEELKQLKAWKTYRVMLNRVDVSKAPDIEWPVIP